MILSSIGLVLLLTVLANAFDNSRFDNVAVYWGQNSYGAGHLADVVNHQKRLAYYCEDDAIDVFPVAFLHVFFGVGDMPSINLANICGPADNGTFPGTELAKCEALASDIATCQAKGKIVTLSLGGATASAGFKSDDQARTFAQTVWDSFLGGSSSMRPFGNAVLDGVDLDIEGGSSAHYGSFVNKIRELSAGSGKHYYITAAPQCVYPDAALGEVLNEVAFDAVYVQFYNNYCGLQNYDQPSNWNFGVWDHWARSLSISKETKIYIGAPAAKSAAGGGYVDIDALSSITTQMRNSFPSFGGVMLWDVSQAYGNKRFDKAIKDSLVAAGGEGFDYPPCSEPEYTAGGGYSAGAKVSYDGYIWQAKWYASQTPAHGLASEWSAVSVCGGPGSPPPSTHPATSAETATTTTASTSTTNSPTDVPIITMTITTTATVTVTDTPGAPTTGPSTTTITTTITSTSTMYTSPGSPSMPTGTSGGQCSSVPAWTVTATYLHDEKVVYNGHLWTAKWWTLGDTPGQGGAGVWVDNGPC